MFIIVDSLKQKDQLQYCNTRPAERNQHRDIYLEQQETDKIETEVRDVDRR